MNEMRREYRAVFVDVDSPVKQVSPAFPSRKSAYLFVEEYSPTTVVEYFETRDVMVSSWRRDERG